MPAGLKTGRMYEFTKSSGKSIIAKIEKYDPVYKQWMIRNSEKTQNTSYIDVKTYKSIRSITTASKKASANKTHLYIFKIGPELYKLGCSDNVEQRMKQGKTWCSSIQLVMKRKIPTSCVHEWRKYESKMHEMVKVIQSRKRQGTGGREIFHLTLPNLKRVKEFVRTMNFEF